MILQSHIKAVFPCFRPKSFKGQTVNLLQNATRILCRFFPRSPLPGQPILPPIIGLSKQRKPLPVDPVIGNIPPGIPKISLIAFFLCQKALPDQLLQVDKIRISRKSGKGLVGRIPIARRAKGKHLPKALSRLL